MRRQHHRLSLQLALQALGQRGECAPASQSVGEGAVNGEALMGVSRCHVSSTSRRMGKYGVGVFAGVHPLFRKALEGGEVPVGCGVT